VAPETADWLRAVLAAVIEGRPNVAAVLCGHAHQPISTTFAGTPLVVAPGVVSTLRLPWAVPGPLTRSAAVDLDEPPGVALHVIDDVGRVTTHFRSPRPPSPARRPARRPARPGGRPGPAAGPGRDKSVGPFFRLIFGGLGGR
jgi:hypothetical protein